MSKYRSSVSKRGSAQRFNRHVGTTKAPNLKTSPMRGGIRL